MSGSCPYRASTHPVVGEPTLPQAVSPRKWPLLGNLPELLWSIARCRGDFISGVVRMLRRHSTQTLELGIGSRRLVITVDPRAAHEILVTAADQLPKTGWEGRVLRPAMEGGSIILEGDAWRRHRGAAASCFGLERMAELAGMTRASMLERLKHWQGEVALGHEYRSVVNDVMFRFFLDHRPSDTDELARSALFMEKGLERSVFLWSHGRHFKNALRELTRKITTRVGVASKRRDGGPALESLLARLPTQEVSQEIRTIIGAGATTSHLLSWLSYLLAAHPEIQAKLRDQIMERLGKGDGPPDQLNRIESIPYLEAVVHEGLRLYPPAPFLLRQSREKRPTFYFVAVWAMHRDPELWAEPESFKPERWLEAGKFRKRLPEAFIPFGLGPRVCVGKRFAMTEARVMLVEALRRFEFVAPSGGSRPKPVFNVLTRPEREVRLAVTAIRQPIDGAGARAA
jgi:cytochrome P450